MRRIDLNADMGESAEALKSGRDAELMRYITSANVACGGHAGDEQTMRETLELAKKLGVAVGAHPSYPDRENFGRLEMVIEMDELEISLRYQLERLRRIAEEVGLTIGHVKPHGALYHSASKDPRVAQAISNVVRDLGDVILVGQAGSMALRHWEILGMRTAAEGFVDRVYEANGELRNRNLPGALLADAGASAYQAKSIVLNGEVTAFSGERLKLRPETLCLHSDTPGSVEIAREVRKVLESSGVEVQSMQRGRRIPDDSLST
jgi:5-oxoprolinase (ATP-hydrolysing) subunit A